MIRALLRTLQITISFELTSLHWRTPASGAAGSSHFGSDGFVAKFGFCIGQRPT
jgi:hypothetical protein